MWIWAIAGLACMGRELRAAISVTLPTGSPLITFNSNPPAADISTHAVPGHFDIIIDPAGLNTVVQTNEAGMITAQLGASADNPPTASPAGRWSSSGRYVQTRPTASACTLVMATFQNDSGWHVTTGLRLDYRLTVTAPATEQVGHVVYYSLSGLANTWLQLAEISNQPDDTNAGTYTRTGSIDLTTMPWPSGSRLYVLWADDNGPGSPDTAMQIDDLSLTLVDPPPTITDPANAAVEQCRDTNFSVQILGGGQPITIQWYKDGVAIDPAINPSAATTKLTISSAEHTDGGSYRCRASNPSGFAFSHPANLTVIPDTTPPALVYAFGEPDMLTISVTFSEPMSAAAQQNFNYRVCEAASPSNCLGLTFKGISADRRTVMLTSDPRIAATSYIVSAVALGDQCRGNPIAPDSCVPLSREFALLGADEFTLWRYNHQGIDLGTAWRRNFYNDSSWSNGYAALGVEDAPPADPPLRTVLVLTNANFPTASIPTYYFRAHFDFPGNPAAPSSRLKLRTAFDDFGVAYVNGSEVYRDTVLGTAGGSEPPFINYYPAVLPIDNAAWTPDYVYVSLSNVVSGDNLVAVKLKQQASNSSDIYMALELVAELGEETCPAITDQPASTRALESEAVTFSVRASGTNLRYEWQKDGAVISGATQWVYRIANARAADAGTYRVRVYNACKSANSILSEGAELIMGNSSSWPTVASARGLPNWTNILITFANGPLSAASAQNVSNYVVPGLTVHAAALQANNVDVLVTTSPRTWGHNYSLSVRDIADTTTISNLIYPNPTVINPLAQTLTVIDWHHPWRLTTNCQDGLSWTAPAFNDGGWALGWAPFGAEDTPATLAFITNATGDGIWAPISPPAANIAQDHYFRTYLNLPDIDLTAVTWTWKSLHDDGAILYMNGSEVWRRDVPNDLSIPLLCADNANDHEADTISVSHATPIYVPPPYEDVIAVRVKQNTNSSPDILWALQLDMTVPVFQPPRPTLCIDLEILPDSSKRLVIHWPCRGSPNVPGYFLQAADDLAGPWETIRNDGMSPVRVAPSRARRLYRLCYFQNCP